MNQGIINNVFISIFNFFHKDLIQINDYFFEIFLHGYV